MSEKGLERSEELASGVSAKVKHSLRQQRAELKVELDKVQYLLSDRAKARQWANSPANAERLQSILASMDEVEKLYLQAGDTHAAQIFKRRMKKQLETRLTNLKANELEVDLKIARTRMQVSNEVLTGLTNIRREGALTEMYEQARDGGGFFANFGRQYLNDLVTLETKAAGSKTLGEYMSNLFNSYETALKDVFVKGIVRGDSYELMQKNLMKASDITEGKAKLLIRTESNAIFNESIKDVIQGNPLVKGYRFRAVLDSKTSKICQQHDGEYIPKDKVKPGVNFPPLHPNCRSTVTTVLVSEDEKKDTIQRYTKNNRNQWEKVPVGMKYNEFKDKFGFSNSKNPATYNPATRDIRDTTLAVLTKPKYKGYVKPSISSVARIDKLIDAYINDDYSYLDKVKQNTAVESTRKALFRQAQAESGFDGLPLQQTAKEFEKEVASKGYKRVYRKFSKAEDLESFLAGGQDYIDYDNGVYGTTTFLSKKEGEGVIEMALKTTPEKTLKLANSSAIKQCATSDIRINDLLAKVPESKRPAVFNIAAVQYGYDVAEFQEEGFDAILNRTAVIVKAPDPVPVVQPTTQLAAGLNKDIRNNKPILGTREQYAEAKKSAILVPKDSDAAKVRQLTAKLGTAEGMDSDALNHLQRYTGAAYADFNRTCRDIYASKDMTGSEYSVERADILSAALYKKRIGEDINLIRSTTRVEFKSQLNESIYEALKGVVDANSDTEANDMLDKLKSLALRDDAPLVLHTDQFESTSVREGSYGSSLEVKLNLLTRADTPGAYINEVSGFKDIEYEAILPPGVSYVVRDFRVEFKYGATFLHIDAETMPGVYEVPKEFSRTVKAIEEISKEA